MKPMKFVFFALLMSQSLMAQNIRVQEKRVTGKDGEKKTTYSVCFIDTATGTVFDSLNLSELNPYNHLPYPVVSIDKSNNNIYKINSFDDYDLLFPEDYRNQYFDEYYFDSVENYKGILTSGAKLSFYNTSGPYLSIGFTLSSFAMHDDNPNGFISSVFVYDSRKNRLLLRQNLPEWWWSVSDDGNYLLCLYGAIGPDVLLIESGLSIININTNCEVYNMKGVFSHPRSGIFPDIIKFDLILDNDTFREYYFNCKTKKIYVFDHSSSIHRNRVTDINNKGIILENELNEEFVVDFDEATEIIDLK